MFLLKWSSLAARTTTCLRAFLARQCNQLSPTQPANCGQLAIAVAPDGGCCTRRTVAHAHTAQPTRQDRGELTRRWAESRTPCPQGTLQACSSGGKHAACLDLFVHGNSPRTMPGPLRLAQCGCVHRCLSAHTCGYAHSSRSPAWRSKSCKQQASSRSPNAASYICRCPSERSQGTGRECCGCAWGGNTHLNWLCILQRGVLSRVAGRVTIGNWRKEAGTALKHTALRQGVCLLSRTVPSRERGGLMWLHTCGSWAETTTKLVPGASRERHRCVCMHA